VKVTWNSLILNLKARCNITEGLNHEISFEIIILNREFKLLWSGENLHIKYYKNMLVFLWKKTENACYKMKMFCKAKRLNSVFLSIGPARPTLCTEHSWCKCKKQEIERLLSPPNFFLLR